MVTRQNMIPNPKRAQYTVLGIGLIQGIILLLLHQWIDQDNNITHYPWVFTLYIVTLYIPASLMYLHASGLSLSRYSWIGVLLQGALLAATSYYSCWLAQAPLHASGAPITDRPELILLYLFSSFIFWLLSLTLIAARQEVHTTGSTYARHYSCGMDITLVFAMASFLLGIFWALLILWAQLFNYLGIEFFEDLFSTTEFIYIATAVAFGYSLFTVRRRYLLGQHALRGMLAAATWLLPLACFITLCFLLTLPFAGLEKLWQTESPAALALGLQIMVLFLANAAYQDGEASSPYPKYLRYMVALAFLLLPFYSLIAAYSLGLRVADYGWTIERVNAGIIILLSAVAACGYAFASFRDNGRWMQKMETVNLAVATLAIAIALLYSTPLLHPAKVSARSQAARLASNHGDIQVRDYEYLRFSLGRSGISALKDLQEDEEAPEEVRKNASLVLDKHYSRSSKTVLSDAPLNLEVHPKNETMPDSLREHLNEQRHITEQCIGRNNCSLIVTDLNHDGNKEYLLHSRGIDIFTEDENGWNSRGQMLMRPYVRPEKLKKALSEHSFSTEANRWDILVIDGHRFMVPSSLQEKE